MPLNRVEGLVDEGAGDIFHDHEVFDAVEEDLGVEGCDEVAVLRIVAVDAEGGEEVSAMKALSYQI